MSKSMRIGIICFCAGVLLAMILIFLRDGNVVKENPKKIGEVSAPKPEDRKTAVERVHSKLIKGTVVMTGRGTDADRGYSREANFRYTLFVTAKSEILKKTEADGRTVIRERRTFGNVCDNLVLSQEEVKLAIFETLPVEDFSKAVDNAAGIVSAVAPTLAGPAAIVVEGKNIAKAMLKKIDGISLTKLFGIGSKTPNAKEYLERLGANETTRALGCVRSVSNKSYDITYYLEKDNSPVLIEATYSNGEKVTEEEELMVLQRVNAFIDYHVMPDPKAQSWVVKASDMQELFDPFVDGTYTGKVKVARDADEGEFWKVKMAPADIGIEDKYGTPIGTLKLSEGSALFNPDKYHIREMKGNGRIDIRRKSKHHLVCTMSISGECEFKGRLVMLDLPDTSNK